MKAAAIEINGGPEAFSYIDMPDPVCPDDGLVIDVEAISIEGGDLLARAMSPLKTVPHVVGYIAAGTVVEVGDLVTERKVGERVVTLHGDGSHATKRAVSAAMIGECLARVASGELKVQIAKVFPLSQAAAAHACIEGRHAFGRVAMTTAG